MLKLILIATTISIVAYVYKNVLLHEPILNWFAKVGDRYEHKWFYKPIWGCAMCFSGQLALWTFVLNCIYCLQISYLSRFLSFVIPIIDKDNLNALNGLFFICLTILITKILNQRL